MNTSLIPACLHAIEFPDKEGHKEFLDELVKLIPEAQDRILRVNLSGMRTATGVLTPEALLLVDTLNLGVKRLYPLVTNKPDMVKAMGDEHHAHVTALIKNSKDALPSLTTMAKSALTSVLNFGKSGFAQATPQQYKDRLNICRMCTRFNPKAYRNTGRCMECGCSTKIKLVIAAEACPLAKWFPVNNN
jgi:hypothetical protein